MNSPLDMTVTHKILSLQELIHRLRAPDGCPWDQKQTPESFKKYVLEEAGELVEAIEHDDSAHVCEELGDLLFQILFVNHLYEEQGKFTLAQVIDSITEKMIRRHPHVFGDAAATTDQELRAQWQKIKEQEQNNNSAVRDKN